MSDPASRARAFGEKALVRFDGNREEIVLSMAVQGLSKKAAWIMPVPAAAEVELGDSTLFSGLESITRPKVVVRKTYWPFRDFDILGTGGDTVGGPAAGTVDVRRQMVLGPFQVARLGGTSATAVTNWLATNGYVVPAGLAANLAPYISEKWEIVAVKLAPKDPKGNLYGATPPLRLSFASQRIVYPMRLSKGATLNQMVTVYVAAPYRVDATQLPDPAVTPELLYAGRVQGASYPQFAAPTSYLTAYSVSYAEPGRISNDFEFARAATDQEFQRVQYVTENDGVLSTIAVILGVPLLIGVGAVVTARLRVKRA
jgi:hypothetical protein